MAQNQNNVDWKQEYERLQYQKLLAEMESEKEAKAEWERKERIRKESAKKEAEFAAESESQRKAAQENCPHNSKDISFVRGQRLGFAKDKDGNIINGFLAFCQLCKKRYDSWESIPAHLRSDIDYFGGPKNY